MCLVVFLDFFNKIICIDDPSFHRNRNEIERKDPQPVMDPGSMDMILPLG